MKSIIYINLSLFLAFSTISSGKNEDSEVINIKEKITLIKNCLRDILIQKNNIKDRDSISITIDTAKSLTIEQNGKSIRTIHSKEKKDGTVEFLYDYDNDGFPDLKVVFNDEGKLLKTYKIKFSEIEVKSKE